jgi:hypothetical protein
VRKGTGEDAECPRFLSRSFKRASGAEWMARHCPEVDGLLFVDLLDEVCGAMTKAVGLTDDEARELLAMIWSGPR